MTRKKDINNKNKIHLHKGYIDIQMIIYKQKTNTLLTFALFYFFKLKVTTHTHTHTYI